MKLKTDEQIDYKNLTLSELNEMIQESGNIILKETHKFNILLKFQQNKLSETLLETVFVCRNPNCKNEFISHRRKEYCSNKCKQEAYRSRKQNGD